MVRRSLVRSAAFFGLIALISIPVLAQSGRVRNGTTAGNDLSGHEKQTAKTSQVETQRPLKDESVKSSQQETKPVQVQRWNDQDVVSIIIVTALVLIVFVGLRKT